VFLFRRRRWARWITLVLCFLAGTGSLVALVAFPIPRWGGRLLMAAMAAHYLYCFSLLGFSRSVRVHFSGTDG